VGLDDSTAPCERFKLAVALPPGSIPNAYARPIFDGSVQVLIAAENRDHRSQVNDNEKSGERRVGFLRSPLD
jgi:hypothetical protein